MGLKKRENRRTWQEGERESGETNLRSKSVAVDALVLFHNKQLDC